MCWKLSVSLKPMAPTQSGKIITLGFLFEHLFGSLRFLKPPHQPTSCRSVKKLWRRLHSNHWPKPDPEIPEIAVIGRSNVGKFLGRKRRAWSLSDFSSYLDLQDAVADVLFCILVGVESRWSRFQKHPEAEWLKDLKRFDGACFFSSLFFKLKPKVGFFSAKLRPNPACWVKFAGKENSRFRTLLSNFQLKI